MNNELFHFGIKGQRWGVRRYQNEDGSLTNLVKKRYGIGGKRSALGTKMDLNMLDHERMWATNKFEKFRNKAEKHASKLVGTNTVDNIYTKRRDKYKNILERNEKMSKAIIDASLEKNFAVIAKDANRSAYGVKVDNFMNEKIGYMVTGTHYNVRNKMARSSQKGKHINAKKRSDIITTPHKEKKTALEKRREALRKRRQNERRREQYRRMAERNGWN